MLASAVLAVIFSAARARPQDGDISPEEFKDGLDKLDNGRKVLNIDDDGVQALVNKFDKDGDGSISMKEFKHFCYNIPALCWKAERVRLEAAGEFVGFEAEGKSPKHETHNYVNAEEAHHKHTVNAELIHETTKLFWRTNEKIEVSLYECDTHHVLCVVGCASAPATPDRPGGMD